MRGRERYVIGGKKEEENQPRRNLLMALRRRRETRWMPCDCFAADRSVSAVNTFEALSGIKDAISSLLSDFSLYSLELLQAPATPFRAYVRSGY